jgi:xanthine dehydrogenase accessory factor
MAVGDSILAGHVSGGCVEGDVANHCYAAIASGKPLRLIYGKGGPWDLPLACGGRIELLIEPVPVGDAALAALLEFSERRQMCMWRTDGVARSCVATDGGNTLLLNEAGQDRLDVYRLFAPRTRLIVIGSDPAALAIAEMAAAMEMEVFFVRPDGPVTPPPILGVSYLRTGPAKALAEIGLDRWTAVATCTHDHDLDNETLVTALGSDAFFVGALGSERRRQARVEALLAAGLDEYAIARVKTPIGLPIGARSPREIALATLAEIVRKQRGELRM